MNRELLADAPVFLKDFITYMLTIKGKSDNTVSEYFFDLRTFLRYMLVLHNEADLEYFDEISIKEFPVELLKKIDLHDLYEYLSYVAGERLNNARARARKVSSLKSFFKYLTAKANILTDNPTSNLDAPKIPKTLPKYLSLGESKMLLDSIHGDDAIRDFAILTVFLNCGLRVSELVGINISNIKNDTLTVIGKGDKERTIYLNNACLAAIENYMRNERPIDGVKDKNALFLSNRRQRISIKTVQHIVKKRLKEAGLDETKYSVHKLRHTAATLMYKYGNVDVRILQEILGHQELSTTQIYTHLDNEQLRNAAAKNPLADFEPSDSD